MDPYKKPVIKVFFYYILHLDFRQYFTLFTSYNNCPQFVEILQSFRLGNIRNRRDFYASFISFVQKKS